jgi:putative hemolysin
VQILYQNVAHLFLMLLLLCCSAFFSAAETAFFNLSSRQINEFKNSRGHLHKLVVQLLQNPSNLLSCFLFGNMIVNVLFFAFASVFTVQTEYQYGVRAAALAAVVFFCILVLFGEIFPKSLAYFNARSMSIAASLPSYFCLRIFMPVISALKFLVVEPALRLLLGHAKRPRTITLDEFLSLIKQARKRGLITDDQGKLISEIVDMGSLKVRDCLRPRVDMTVCNIADSPQTVKAAMRQHHLSKLPVYSKKIDNIVGMIYLRQLLLEPEKSVEKLIEPVHFVPEQKSIESLLDFFRKTRTDTAVVVNEYGGIEGTICIEDVVEELLGPVKITAQPEPIEPIGPFEYRLSGNVAIRDWADAFDIDLEQTRITTIGGFITALLGKIPQPGDTANIGNVKFTVESVRKHRIETVIFKFEPIKEND